ncbi:hypothetical protein C1646_674592 [Rhizophagus diaphanus]|nr:hypothetical protein C1646_674592 [Rhizophagus diaphanus] [Rhizophagus sp. MUCL 43196]
MATIGIAAPIFHGQKDKDLNLFINNFLGYINTIGIDPLDDASAPPGQVRVIGVFRSCMRDEAARALVFPEGAGGPNAGTYVSGSDSSTYAGVVGNAAVIIGAAFFPLHADVVRTNFKVEEQWRRAGASGSFKQKLVEPTKKREMFS